MEKTKIQMQIEDTVTNSRGYERKNHLGVPSYLLNTEIGLQISLLTKDCYDHKISPDKAIEFMPQLEVMIKKFRDAGIPLGTITTAEGFKEAFNAAYLIPFSKYLRGVNKNVNSISQFKNKEE
jgi:hypothetical protein